MLITGGSQGARLLSELTPLAITNLPDGLRLKLRVQQQTRRESLEGAIKVYKDALVPAEIAPFFRDMAGRLGAAHLVIGRAGASTCCELAVAGKPSILIPLKIAADDHQRFNAKLLADAGGAEVAAEDMPMPGSLHPGPDQAPQRPRAPHPHGRGGPLRSRARWRRTTGGPGGEDGGVTSSAHAAFAERRRLSGSRRLSPLFPLFIHPPLLPTIQKSLPHTIS